MTKVDLQHGNCLELLKAIPECSIDFVATDPPYFIDGMGDDWQHSKLSQGADKASVVGGMPVGMKFDPDQSERLYRFCVEVFIELFRVMKPGAFLTAFSQARLYHSMAQAAQDCDFEIRDMLAWVYDQSQAKAFSLSHFISPDLPIDQQARLRNDFEVYKTPQLRPMIEPILLAQKPKEGTFIENWIKWGVGLMNTEARLDMNKFPGNVLRVAKPDRNEKESNSHFTVKPILLMTHLIELFCPQGGVVLDPFMGSGTTAVSAVILQRGVIGIEKEQEYFDIAKARVDNELQRIQW